MVSNITCSKLNNHHNKKHTDAEYIFKNPQNYSMVYKYTKKNKKLLKHHKCKCQIVRFKYQMADCKYQIISMVSQMTDSLGNEWSPSNANDKYAYIWKYIVNYYMCIIYEL